MLVGELLKENKGPIIILPSHSVGNFESKPPALNSEYSLNAIKGISIRDAIKYTIRELGGGYLNPLVL